MIEFSALVKYNIICYFRDKKSFVLRLLEVIMITLILGFALKDNFLSENVTIKSFKVGLVIEDKGKYSDSFIKYIDNSECKDSMEIINYGSLEEAKLQLSSSHIKNLIYIPNTYSENILSGKKGEIKLITERERNYYDNTVNEILNSFNKYEELKVMENKIGEAKLDKMKGLDVKYITAKGKTPKAMDYYGVTMLVMLILFSSRQGVRAYSRVKKTAVGERQRMAPISKRVDVLAAIVAQFILGTFEWVLYVALCKNFLNVNYGNNIVLFVSLCSIFSIFSIFFGIILGEIVGNYGKAQSLLQILIYMSTFLAGGFSGAGRATESNNIVVSTVFNMLPSEFGHNILFSYIYSGDKGSIINSLGAMVMEILALILIAAWVGKGRKA